VIRDYGREDMFLVILFHVKKGSGLGSAQPGKKITARKNIRKTPIRLRK
jgi:hypothetical protein